jgi:hypothetical protein
MAAYMVLTMEFFLSSRLKVMVKTPSVVSINMSAMGRPQLN